MLMYMYLKCYLYKSSSDSKWSREEDHEWCHQFNKMVDKSFKFVEVFRRLMHVVTNGIRDWLGLSNRLNKNNNTM